MFEFGIPAGPRSAGISRYRPLDSRSSQRFFLSERITLSARAEPPRRSTISVRETTGRSSHSRARTTFASSGESVRVKLLSIQNPPSKGCQESESDLWTYESHAEVNLSSDHKERHHVVRNVIRMSQQLCRGRVIPTHVVACPKCREARVDGNRVTQRPCVVT